MKIGLICGQKWYRPRLWWFGGKRWAHRVPWYPKAFIVGPIIIWSPEEDSSHEEHIFTKRRRESAWSTNKDHGLSLGRSPSRT